MRSIVFIQTGLGTPQGLHSFFLQLQPNCYSYRFGRNLPRQQAVVPINPIPSITPSVQRVEGFSHPSLLAFSQRRGLIVGGGDHKNKLISLQSVPSRRTTNMARGSSKMPLKNTEPGAGSGQAQLASLQ